MSDDKPKSRIGCAILAAIVGAISIGIKGAILGAIAFGIIGAIGGAFLGWFGSK